VREQSAVPEDTPGGGGRSPPPPLLFFFFFWGVSFGGGPPFFPSLPGLEFASKLLHPRGLGGDEGVLDQRPGTGASRPGHSGGLESDVMLRTSDFPAEAQFRANTGKTDQRIRSSPTGRAGGRPGRPGAMGEHSRSPPTRAGAETLRTVLVGASIDVTARSWGAENSGWASLRLRRNRPFDRRTVRQEGASDSFGPAAALA